MVQCARGHDTCEMLYQGWVIKDGCEVYDRHWCPTCERTLDLYVGLGRTEETEHGLRIRSITFPGGVKQEYRYHEDETQLEGRLTDFQSRMLELVDRFENRLSQKDATSLKIKIGLCRDTYKDRARLLDYMDAEFKKSLL